MNFDFVLDVRLYTTKDGGRKTDIVGNTYSCPLFLEDIKNGFDCRFYISNQKLPLGQSIEVDVKMLDPIAFLKHVEVGTKVKIWEGKIVGEGLITKIYAK